MKVIVLGSTGMLGRYVYSYLKQKFDVIELNRHDFNAEFISYFSLDMMLQKNNIERGDVIINCIGVIKQRKNISNLEYLRTNSAFPLMLADACKYKDIKVIHITTDCVFNGKTEYNSYGGIYNENSIHNPEDVYGKTKSLGEPGNCTVIRTSVIGEELKSKLSLIEWVKSNRDKEVNGFKNHAWNGITCLQFAKICEEIIEKDLYWEGVRHIFSPDIVTKAKLVQMISDVYDLNIKVNLIEAPNKCIRTLNTIFPIIFKIPNLIDQIKEQKDFYKNLLN